LLTVASPGTSYYEDHSVVNGTTYYYTLVAIDGESPANQSVPSVQLSATPKALKVASSAPVVTPTQYVDSGDEKEEKEIKSGETEEEEENEAEEEEANVPTIGIIILILLIALGLYLLYLQNPDILEKLKFWKRRR
jgi:hypothetical protein